MLLANISTAQKIQEEFPNCAVLRRHPSPPISNFDPLIKAAISKVQYNRCKMSSKTVLYYGGIRLH